MPREERRIFFDNEEAYKAIFAFSEVKALPKPPLGHISLIENHADNPLEIIVTLENGRTGSTDTIKYKKDFAIAALMNLCRDAGIPLPKGSNKTLEIIDGKAVLRVQMLR